MPPSAPDQMMQLAALMLAQGWDRPRMNAAIRIAWDTDQVRIDHLVDATMAAWHQPYPPNTWQLADFLDRALDNIDLDIDEALRSLSDLPLIVQPAEPAPPIAALGDLKVPVLENTSALADWLDVTEVQLEWFADCDGRLARRGPDQLRHYRELWLRKRNGGRRLVEAPLPKLKTIQRKILHGILGLVPIHSAAYGFVAGRNCQQHASRHAGETVVVTLDLKDFFTSVTAGRVHAIFRSLGYSHPVARMLTGLVTTRTPTDVLANLPDADRMTWTEPHLPQGAPTSPALANLAAHGLDCRLSALAARVDARYSRYADDLAFSGDRGLVFDAAQPLLEQVAEIVEDCGFRIHPSKTRIQRQGRRQCVTGIVVNQHLNLARGEFDRLKATLMNCVRHGPSTQNRKEHPAFEAHLKGRVGWVSALNPNRGRKLCALLDRIDWTS